MVQAPKVIRVEPGSELDRLLAEAGEQGLVLVRDDARYRLVRLAGELPEPDARSVELADERDIWAGYDPERLGQALARSAGALTGVDRDQLLADLREEREQHSGGRPA